jgi:hypothetical protein
MEDIKKIQEFFSKPLEEGKQLDQVDFAKVVQAVTKTGHPVTVLLVPKFNEIEVITGMNAPDDMLFDLSNAVDALGYGNDDIIIAGDSSNLSRREYSDIRRVNGGAKDYFEESLDEAKRPEPNYKELVKLLIMAFKHEPKARFYFNRNNGVVFFDLAGGAAYSPKKSTMRDIFGGMSPIAVNREFGRADHHEEETIKQVEQLSKGKIKAEIKELGNGVLYKLKNEPVDEYNTGIYYKGEETQDKAKEASKSALGKVKDFIKKVIKEEEITVDDATEFKLNLKHLLDKHVVKEEEGYSQFLKTDDNPEGKTKGLDTATMNKILMNVIKDIEETIELGKQLDEKKLCKKGQAYRKRRMAAGEKSSAYLSGRAVKVCKGQMSGKKKKKK